MLIDYRAFFRDWETLKVSAVMIVLVTGASLVTANLLMDLLALVVNPRLRKGDN